LSVISIPIPSPQDRDALQDGDLAVYPTGVDVLALSGGLDLATGPLLALATDRRPRPLSGELALDLTDLRFLDCSGITALLQLRRQLHAQSCSLVLRHLRLNVRQVLVVTQLAATFGIVDITDDGTGLAAMG
jgi:anti-anti-sigma factor